MIFPLIDLIWLIAILCVVGVLLWGLNQIPVDDTIKKIIRVVIIVVVCIWLIYFLVSLLTGIAPLRVR